ncbi:uncharacterized protein LOC123527843 [Mercenaria mercenaria]|uniref:uncharacterized protein LOC123527843 n=1 Tax=Mercenaria mercenaria TaxID=6596 RepID=UPI00234E8927|nr:uncharacterized protein LOC123527843 [Mercenaria mercenaria]
MLKNCLKEEDSIKQGLSAISRHPFGDHSHCDPSWCRFLRNGHSKSYSCLPYGKPLTDQLLKVQIEQLFQSYKPKAKHLLKIGSTQPNESFNMTVASKAPKSTFYGGSDSLNFRVASAVLQKNEGKTYVADVSVILLCFMLVLFIKNLFHCFITIYIIIIHKKLNLSPGKYTLKRRQFMDIESSTRKEKSKSKESKRRRLQLKQLRSGQYQEIREGKSYETEIDLAPEFEAHNAREDVIALKKIYEVTCTDATPYTFSWSYISESLTYSKQTKENMITWQPMISSKAISKSMARKASASGLKLCHVMKAHARDESEGIKILFSEKMLFIKSE